MKKKQNKKNKGFSLNCYCLSSPPIQERFNGWVGGYSCVCLCVLVCVCQYEVVQERIIKKEEQNDNYEADTERQNEWEVCVSSGEKDVRDKATKDIQSRTIFSIMYFSIWVILPESEQHPLVSITGDSNSKVYSLHQTHFGMNCNVESEPYRPNSVFKPH